MVISRISSGLTVSATAGLPCEKHCQSRRAIVRRGCGRGRERWADIDCDRVCAGIGPVFGREHDCVEPIVCVKMLLLAGRADLFGAQASAISEGPQVGVLLSAE